MGTPRVGGTPTFSGSAENGGTPSKSEENSRILPEYPPPTRSAIFPETTRFRKNRGKSTKTCFFGESSTFATIIDVIDYSSDEEAIAKQPASVDSTLSRSRLFVSTAFPLR